LRQVLPQLLEDETLVPVAELYVEAMRQDRGLPSFFFAWTAAERLVHEIFADRHLVADAEPGRPRITLSALVDRFQARAFLEIGRGQG
jgi:hypothetical protein